MTVIDLGFVETDPVSVPPGPVRVSRWANVVAGAAVLALVGGSAVQAPQTVHDAWSAPLPSIQSILVPSEGNSMVYVFSPDNADEGAQFSAYRLATGKLDWRISLSAGVGTLPAVAGGHLMVVDGAGTVQRVENDGSVDQISYTTSFRAIDPATGKTTWRGTGGPAADDGRTVLTEIDNSDGNLVELRLLHDADGSQIWQLPVTIGSAYDYDDGRLFVLDPDGELRIYRSTDLTLLRSAQVATDPGHTALDAQDGRLIVTDDSAVRTTGYDYMAATLTEVWQQDDILYRCGPVLCSYVTEPTIVAHDPVTGRRLWSATAGTIDNAGATTVVVDGLNSSQQLVDARNGARIGPAGATWAGVADLSSGPASIMLWPTKTLNEVRVVAIESVTRKTTTLGAVPRRQQCEVRGSYLLCIGTKNQLVATTLEGR